MYGNKEFYKDMQEQRKILKKVNELNQFMNTWNPYVEPKEEIKDEVGEEVHA